MFLRNSASSFLCPGQVVLQSCRSGIIQRMKHSLNSRATMSKAAAPPLFLPQIHIRVHQIYIKARHIDIKAQHMCIRAQLPALTLTALLAGTSRILSHSQLGIRFNAETTISASRRMTFVHDRSESIPGGVSKKQMKKF